jgi:hypothetical protein
MNEHHDHQLRDLTEKIEALLHFLKHSHFATKHDLQQSEDRIISAISDAGVSDADKNAVINLAERADSSARKLEKLLNRP